MKKLYQSIKKLTLACLLFSASINAQTWEDVGTSGSISASTSSWNNLAVDASGNYYVSYYDLSVSKGSVQKFDGTSWSYLGGAAGITTGSATYSSLSQDDMGNTYYTNQVGYPSAGVEVRQFDGTSWTQLTSATTSSANYQASKVSPSNVLFVYSSDGSGTVRRLVNGTWEQVGSAGIAGALPYNAEMVIGTDNKVYVCHYASGVKVYSNLTTATDSDPWTLVGEETVGSGFTETTHSTSDIAIDASNNIYVVYSSNAANNRRLNVKKFNGTSWNQVGDVNFGISDNLYDVAIAVSPNGEVYVVASGWAVNSGRNTVYKLNHSTNTWETFGGDFISTSTATYNDLVYDAINDVLVLTYTESGVKVKRIETTEVTYDSVTSVDVTTSGSVAAEITQNAGTLQLVATVNPSGANQGVTWSIINGGEYASLGANGLVSALANGTITIRATSVQDTSMYDEIDIVISNQVIPSTCTFSALELSGFNADVVAEGTGGNTVDKTTHTVDAFYTFYAQDFVPLNPHSSGASADAYGGGFPNNGTLSNTAVSGLSFQLADFSTNNALVLRNSVTNQGTLTLATPKKAQTIYIAAVRGEGGSTSADNHDVTATVNFSDGSSEVLVFQATAWWFDSGAPSNIVMANTGEVSRNTATTGWAPRNEFRGLTNTNLFYNELTLDPSNYAKNIISIDFDKAVTSNDAHTTAILGISICESNYTSEITGFNYDIIANGIGDASASSDLGLDEVNSRALVSLDFQATASSSFPTYGLPADGVINSANTSGVTFQLADYSGPNALYLTPSYVTGSVNTQSSGTLSFSADNVGNIYILSAAAGGGSSNLPYTAVVNFSDGSSQTADLQAKDWYDGSGYAIQGIGRVNRANNNLEGTASNPRLYEDVITLYPANQTKIITGITFSFAGDSTAPWANEIRLAILAVTTTQSTLSSESFDKVQTEISVYPNPTLGVITVKSNSDLASVQVYNSIGQEVLESKVQKEIDLSNLPSGIYIVRIQSIEGITSIHKVIKK